MSWKAAFRRFREADPERLHFAAHSHHYWPDVAFEAQRRCWEDAARLADRKWERIFGEVIPRAQAGIAGILKLSDPSTIAFGPNTHGFLLRLLSCLPQERAVRVLTSDGEFHSFERQLRRLEESGRAEVTRVPTEPFDSFTVRFRQAAAEGGRDLIYLSQVFYNSGYAVPDLPGIVAAVPEPEALVVIDGYHGFLARPTDLSAVEDRAFYMSGGYKYAMAGEGACFLHCPPGLAARPPDTGWFAAFGALTAKAQGEVPYGADGSRFLGATFDPVGIYRQTAVLDWLAAEGITAAAIHDHARALQEAFVAVLPRLGIPGLSAAALVVPLEETNRGNFLTFRTPQAGGLYEALLARNVITDHRGDRLRFGFGIYQDHKDVAALAERLHGLERPAFV
ncbi:MAG: aminotransferase class V-fold PLP-dependent enzyme [Kiloniellales bacterium]|nr:aminotransferase class V-fold PLP-dependent enzyme [Kiloniellales bacterium]